MPKFPRWETILAIAIISLVAIAASNNIPWVNKLTRTRA